MINNNEFEINNQKGFIQSLIKSKKLDFLTLYSPEEYMRDFTTYKLKGYDIGYVIKRDGDIVSVFNNSTVRNVSEPLLQSAIKNGGKKLDHFDGFLTGLYERLGFKEIQRFKWVDEYKPQHWDVEKYGKPDVIMRELEKIENFNVENI